MVHPLTRSIRAPACPAPTILPRRRLRPPCPSTGSSSRRRRMDPTPAPVRLRVCDRTRARQHRCRMRLLSEDRRIAAGRAGWKDGTRGMLPRMDSRCADASTCEMSMLTTRMLQYWYAAGPSTGLPASYFAIDPSLDFDPTTLPSLPFSHVGSPRLPDPPAEFYDSNREDRRLFSSATIVDHGSPPASPEPSVLADSAGSTIESQLQAPTVGVSREEWLRLGGFSDDPGLPSLPPPPPPRSAPVQLPCTPTKRRADDLREPLHAAPHAPVHPLPPPVASAPPAMQYPLPAAPPLPPPVPSVLAPVKLEEDDSPLATAGQLPARSKRRRAPSPLNPTRLRPSPYPTSSSSAISSPRILTPVSHALAHYADHPVPEHPPPQADPDAPTKKKHGRKVSVGHVPRPRNAFILFRSHAVTSGLIPRSVGINVRCASTCSPPMVLHC